VGAQLVPHLEGEPRLVAHGCGGELRQLLLEQPAEQLHAAQRVSHLVGDAGEHHLPLLVAHEQVLSHALERPAEARDLVTARRHPQRLAEAPLAEQVCLLGQPQQRRGDRSRHQRGEEEDQQHRHDAARDEPGGHLVGEIEQLRGSLHGEHHGHGVIREAVRAIGHKRVGSEVAIAVAVLEGNGDGGLAREGARELGAIEREARRRAQQRELPARVGAHLLVAADEHHARRSRRALQRRQSVFEPLVGARALIAGEQEARGGGVDRGGGDGGDGTQLLLDGVGHGAARAAPGEDRQPEHQDGHRQADEQEEPSSDARPPCI